MANKDDLKAKAKQEANDEPELKKEGVLESPVQYDVDPEAKGPKSDEEVIEAGAEPLVKDIADINLEDPSEGDAYIDANGDLNTFRNGAWNVTVHHSATTF